MTVISSTMCTALERVSHSDNFYFLSIHSDKPFQVLVGVYPFIFFCAEFKVISFYHMIVKLDLLPLTVAFISMSSVLRGVSSTFVCTLVLSYILSRLNILH